MNFNRSWGALIAVCICTFNAFAQKTIVEKLPSNINSSEYDEISPIISHQSDALLFTRVAYPVFEQTIFHEGEDLSSTLSKRQYEATLNEIYSEIAGRKVVEATYSSYNQDIWIAAFNGNSFGKVSHPGYPLNNALPNSISSTTEDDDTYVTINQFEFDGGMQRGFSTVRRVQNNWTHPVPMTIDNYYTQHPDVGLSMSSDGQILILSLKRKDSKGSTDLYYCRRKSESVWSEPINMGPVINSYGREITPHLSADQKMMFFASNRDHKNPQTDIYISYRLDDSWTNWSEPKRLANPIN
ncbi:MAG: hypothetical protein AAFO94_06265, partial [Bacteroidota bacterium]